MTHEEISRQYTKLISEFKENVNLAFGIYSEKSQDIDKQLYELQQKCDHQAAPSQFLDGACPFCHLKIK